MNHLNQHIALIQVIGITASGLGLSGLLIFVLRKMVKKIDCKVDKALCEERLKNIQSDLSRGHDTFEGMKKEISGVKDEQAKTNQLIARIDERIKAWITQNS